MKRHEAIHHRPGSVAVLDIGTTKVVCFIGQVQDSGEIHITGIGHQLAKGMRAGVIVDVGEVESSILAAVNAAEQMAGETIENVVVSVGGNQIQSKSVSVELEITAGTVADQDIVDLIQEGCASLDDGQHSILHVFPIQYYLDNSKGLSDPRGMIGELLGAELNIVTARNTYLRNLLNCVARCHLNIDAYILGAHAAALAALNEDEMELGVTLIDMGGGTTNIAVFFGGKNIFSDSIPLGGRHVTNDIARGLSTSLAQAERLKTIHGSAIGSAKDAEVMIDVPQLGEEEDDDDTHQMPRSMLIGVVRPRMEEMFEMVRARLEAAGVDKIAGRRCVLTGGGSQMLGVGDLAGRLLAKQVRKGKPVSVPGQAEMATGPSFATAIGMIKSLEQRNWEDNLMHNAASGRGMARVKDKIMNWLREHF